MLELIAVLVTVIIIAILVAKTPDDDVPGQL